MRDLIFYVGAFDALVLLALGAISAGMYLFDVKSKYLDERMWPAAGITIATSVGAVLILLVTRWIASWGWLA